MMLEDDDESVVDVATGAAFTVTATGADADGLNDEFPAYATLTESTPIGNADVVNAAVPPESVPVPIAVVPL